MEQRRKWKQVLFIIYSIAVLLSAYPAVQLRAEESAGQEVFGDGGWESRTVSGSGGEGIGQYEEGDTGQKEEEEKTGQTDDVEDTGLNGDTEDSVGTVSGGGTEAAEEAGTNGMQGEEASPINTDNLAACTDVEGNVFSYELDGEGNAVITSIMVSGKSLTVPDIIDGAPVAAVENGTECVVANPETPITDITINCRRVGTGAFSGLTIGTLTIGENVEEFSVSTAGSTTFLWMQFASSKIDRVVYEAVEIPVSIPMDTSLYTANRGPFYQAQVGDVVFGGNVEMIPEFLFIDSYMELDELTINTPRIGAYAFYGEGISIGVLTLGEDVKSLEECSDHIAMEYSWCQFGKAAIGTLRMDALDLNLGHGKEAGSGFQLYGPFWKASIGSFEIGGGAARIPEAFLAGAFLTQEELSIGTAAIGAYAFAGPGISIGTLTLEESVKVFEESFFSSTSRHCYCQFQSAKIGKYRFLVPELEMGHTMGKGLTNDVYGPFYDAEVGGLEIGENVMLIPEYFMDHASMALGDFVITTPEICGCAFGGGRISFDTLTIGQGVKVFSETCYSTAIKQYWGQFRQCRIGSLVYQATEAAATHREEEPRENSDIFPPFEAAEIGSLVLAEDIKCIPDYLLYQSILSMDELTLNVPVIGGRAFAGPDIAIGKLTIGSGVEQFSLAPKGCSTFFHWEQFASAVIGELCYETAAAEMEGFIGDSKYYFGPFRSSTIGLLHFGDGVEEIPKYCFADSRIDQEELEIHAPVVGPGAFSGKEIKIGVLTLGEEVERFPYLADFSLKYFRQFYSAQIGTVRLLSPHIATSVSCYKGPFEDCTISSLEIGERAEVIPDFMFYNAKMVLDGLALENVAVGHRAFSGRMNRIGRLYVGADVAYSGTIEDKMYCFEDAGIDMLEYNGTGMNALWSTSTSAYGMFAEASIARLHIGEDADCIPMAWFRDAALTQDELTVPCGWGAYAFKSRSIKIGTLYLTGDVQRLFPVDGHDNGFSDNTIGTVVYDIPSALFETQSTYAKGPFDDAEVNSFVLGENVDYLDEQLLSECSFTECRVYAVKASDSFLAQEFMARYLPASTELYIHHNSGFNEYFTSGAGSVNWMCEDFYEVSYGGKVYDEETGEYRAEVIRFCPVCGYKEKGMEELDDSCEVYLSIPVEIPLAFSGDTKSYEGRGSVYAYEKLGNAYEGVRLSVDTSADLYGTAKKGEAEIDISAYFSAGFQSGGAASFTPVQVSGNQEALLKNDPDSLYTDSLTVSVMGIAFLQSGPGDYDMPIPLRIEIY